MKRFKRGDKYLTKIGEGSKPWKGLYRCEVCLAEREFDNNRIDTGHTKTCGCRNGKRTLNYNVTEEGNIISDGGYDLTSLVAKGYRGFAGGYVHRIVATKFIPNPNNYTDVNHIDGNKQNNNVKNLEWCTRAENLQHAIATGLKTYKTGFRSHRATLTDAEVREIRASTGSGKVLCKKYGVSSTTFYSVRNRKIYRYIK